MGVLAKVWDADPPAYYDPPGGLMGFRMDYGGLINGSVPTLPDMKLPSFAGHFSLVNHQLLQVRIPCLARLVGYGSCTACRCPPSRSKPSAG